MSFPILLHPVFVEYVMSFCRAGESSRDESHGNTALSMEGGARLNIKRHEQGGS